IDQTREAQRKAYRSVLDGIMAREDQLPDFGNVSGERRWLTPDEVDVLRYVQGQTGKTFLDPNGRPLPRWRQIAEAWRQGTGDPTGGGQLDPQASNFARTGMTGGTGGTATTGTGGTGGATKQQPGGINPEWIGGEIPEGVD